MREPLTDAHQRMAMFRITQVGQLRTHLAARRRAEGLTQAELAKRLGVSHSRISQIETAPERVTVGQFLTVLRALRIEMLLGTSQMAPPAGGGDEGW
jgi:HTH-type transcriptional regulator / antitoxin HipB